MSFLRAFLHLVSDYLGVPSLVWAASSFFPMQSLYLSTETVQTLLFVVLKWNAGLLLSLATAGFSTTLLREIHQSMKKPRRAPKQELGLIEESNEMSELEKLK